MRAVRIPCQAVPFRARLALFLLAVFTLGGALLIVARADDGDGLGDPGTGFTGAVRPDGIPPAPFRLRDQNGRVVTLADLRGRPAIVTFLYTTCEDTCPTTAAQIRGALDDLGGARVPAVAISVDPGNDTPERARRFLARQHLTGRMRFLLGTRAELAPLWKAYGIQPQGNGKEHSGSVVLLDRRGAQRVGHPASALTPEGLAHDLKALDVPS